ncbi:hypothetical protein KSC_106160 [Ktedonobacter sp. SOSP1-52]|uniref:hypothetical protein n=1 Tax=Ktedonobacter sp. SOSP1-52 TaxID=2778366 RepID=UPI0019158F19|nr:hypothetical protein [Ktedonobacter sp. SOSP1-52]GHO71724.1 hypothetical protein KSC_106160 [Ktedonobacter sp. SOSP1-52]
MTISEIQTNQDVPAFQMLSEDLRRQAKAIGLGQLVINGIWRSVQDDKTRADINPATGEVIPNVAEGSVADLDDVVKAMRPSSKAPVDA